MSSYSFSRDGQASSSVSFEKKYDLDVNDVNNIRIYSKHVSEAAKILYQEQKNIMRMKSCSKESKQLPKCIEKFDESLIEIREKLKMMGSILDKDRTSLNVPKKKNRKVFCETFTTDEATECFRCLSKDRKIQDLELHLKRIERCSEQNIMQLTESLDDLQRRYDKLDLTLKDDALQSGQNRPKKVAEKLSEVYDNQWTDAFGILKKQMEEKQVIHTLLNTLMTAYDTCQELSSRNFFERVQKAIELPTEAVEISNYTVVLTDQLKQEIKEFRRNRAPFVIRDVEKVVRPRLPLAKHHSKEVQEYVTACVEIAWLYAVQDPPLKLDAKFTNRFNNNVFKDYTTPGEFVDFVVWPAMFLHKGGPLLSKGVAQGKHFLKQYDHIPRSQWSDSSEI